MPSHNRRGNIAFALALIAVLGLFASDSFARPAAKADAASAVGGWLKQPGRGLGAPVGKAIDRTETHTDATGAPVYYVVYLKPSGFVIVPADDAVEPIICFSPAGQFVASDSSPLGALVTRDVPARVARARADAKAAPGADVLAAQSKWSNLRLAGGNGVSALGKASISDMRVGPLTQTTWDQTTVMELPGPAIYNYYTPPGPDGSMFNYPSGCVATMLAQLMYYYQYPTLGVGTASFPITVDYFPQLADLRGGDGFGGPYDWANMTPSPDSATVTFLQQQAIGALCYDAGVAVYMNYSAFSSDAYMSDAAIALQTTFMFSNALDGTKDFFSNIGPALIGMVNPNLDAGFPVLFGISGSPGGHAVIGDGYGYDGKTLYHHLNMGWSGVDNVWYNLPTIASPIGPFNVLSECVYNIYVNGSGEIISGRVLDKFGNPLGGVAVTAVGPSGVYTATTNARGIYAFAKVPSATTFSLTATAPGHSFLPLTAATGTSTMYGAVSGNVWGENFTDLGPGANLTMIESPAGSGTTIPPQEQTTIVPKNVFFTISAMPASGYLFDRWTSTTSATITDSTSPVTTARLSADATVTATFVQPQSGTVWDWGLNSNGEVGDGTILVRTAPRRAVGLTNIIQAMPPPPLAGGQYHSLALSAAGTVYAWGKNDVGQLGIGSLVEKHAPVSVAALSNIAWIAAGSRHSVAVDATGANVWAWGYNAAGELGDGTRVNRNSPVKVKGLTGLAIFQVAAGDSHTLALDSNGSVWAWGGNTRGQLGIGNTLASLKPVQVRGLANVTAIAAGMYHSLALDGNGQVWAWGANESGQLGIGTRTDASTPVPVWGLIGVAQIAAGGWHSLAIDNAGAVWTWGANWYGELGDGTTSQSTSPVLALQAGNIPFQNAIQVVGGSCHSAVLDAAGTVWTMGWNKQGQLGDGTFTDHLYAQAVPGLAGAGGIGAGGWSTLSVIDAPRGTSMVRRGAAGASLARNNAVPAVVDNPEDPVPLVAVDVPASAPAVPAAADAPAQSGTGPGSDVAAPQGTPAWAPVVPPRATAGGSVACDGIVDDRDHSEAKQFKPMSGAWASLSSAGAYAGGCKQTGASTGAETARARFSCTGLSAGKYDVYAWWPAKPEGATHVAYEVHHAAGGTTVRVNQNVGGGQWNLLGAFDFEAGSHVVDVHNGSSAPGIVVSADAVRFVPAGTALTR